MKRLPFANAEDGNARWCIPERDIRLYLTIVRVWRGAGSGGVPPEPILMSAVFFVPGGEDAGGRRGDLRHPLAAVPGDARLQLVRLPLRRRQLQGSLVPHVRQVMHIHQLVSVPGIRVGRETDLKRQFREKSPSRREVASEDSGGLEEPDEWKNFSRRK